MLLLQTVADMHKYTETPFPMVLDENIHLWIMKLCYSSPYASWSQVQVPSEIAQPRLRPLETSHQQSPTDEVLSIVPPDLVTWTK